MSGALRKQRGSGSALQGEGAVRQGDRHVSYTDSVKLRNDRRNSNRRDSNDSGWIEMASERDTTRTQEYRRSTYVGARPPLPSEFSQFSDNTALRSLASLLLNPEGEVFRAAHPQAVSTPLCRFVLIVIIFVLTFFLRWASLIVFVVHKQWVYVGAQLGVEFLLWILSTMVAFQDNDIQRCLAAGPCLRQAFSGCGTCLCCGAVGIIHIKRAWARQIHVAEVLESPEGQQDFVMTGPAVGAERALPVALFSSVLFALFNTIAYLQLNIWWQECDGAANNWFFFPCNKIEAKLLLLLSSLLQTLQVTFAVAEVDNCVSNYVASRYHFDHKRRGKHLGRLQWLYPLAHMFYRYTEITARVFLIAEYVVLLAHVLGFYVGTTCFMLYIVMSFVVGVYVLHRYAPSEEQMLVHVFVGFPMLFTNVARFVDRPGFRRPAKQVSNIMECVHFLETIPLLLIFGVALVLRMLGRHGRQWAEHYNPNSDDDFMTVIPGITILITLMFALGATVGRKRGHDLHSAVESGNMDEMSNLLNMGTVGEALDPNGQTKDRAKETPTMLAAARNNVEALEMLMGVGARVQVSDAAGYTCIHHALKRPHFEAMHFLTQCRGAREVLRKHKAELRSIAISHQSLSEDMMEELLRLLDPRSRGSPNCSPAANGNMRAVRAQMSCGRHLRELFPDAMEEDVPPLHELQSVSALVFANAYGPLSRKILPRCPGAGLLPSLRRVRTLGQGASGEVIEVEEVTGFSSTTSDTSLSNAFSPSMSNTLRRISSNPWRRMSTTMSGYTSSYQASSKEEGGPRHFAMKLQAKTQKRSEALACSEAVVLRRAVHPFIVKIEEAFQTPHSFAILLELCTGGDLNKLLCALELDDSPGFSPIRAAKYSGQVLLALVYLHEAVGIVYRDIKPENILLSGNDEAKLADFGLACYVGRDVTTAYLPPVGTAGFMAPELVLGSESFVVSVSDGGRESRNGETYETSSQTLTRLTGVMNDTNPVDPFKTDAYSFGVTLTLMLLGSTAADLVWEDTEEEGSCPVLLVPANASEAERVELLESACDEGRLSDAALELLLCLVPHRPSHRCRLNNYAVLNHRFYLRTLGCESLAEFLLPPGAPCPGGGTIRRPATKEATSTPFFPSAKGSPATPASSRLMFTRTTSVPSHL